jgi:hypothetical protein
MTKQPNVLDLSSYLSNEWLQLYKDYLPTAREWWLKNTTTKSKFGVDQSTARSYSTGQRGPINGPVAVFNEWAQYQMQALDQDPEWRQTLNTREGFERAHAGFAASLAGHWRQRVSQVSATLQNSERLPRKRQRVTLELATSQKYKFVDLFVRHLWIERSDRSLDAESSFPHARSPLDRKSLHVLSATFSGILMAPRFSMGMVDSEAKYSYCQALVDLVCRVEGGTPLLFDVFAWHHPSAKSLYGPSDKKKPHVSAVRLGNARAHVGT